ncbi:hypothetical protein [Prochlorococcus sp. MIT 1300]|nr:hypothetical protein [Prochlorococcus sp. MIT 1300]
MIPSTDFFATIAIGGFQPLAAAFGAIALIQVSQFIFYGLNDPSDK